ncbi:hypothetical protein NGF75_05015 [Dietzia kunjamensis]|uniref:hypothetical protein n=1 Tax=Dietzia kunjamensis TaxID=322509 RepID=UPI002DB7BD41|nr:hypothetical protein [Dietzia kunjamensis]MEB8325348.1 hypothetical protein [Dietzia kunjamensis]
MRTTTLAATVSALAAAALLTGAGTATADDGEPVGPVDTDTAAGCVYIRTHTEALRCMNLEPAAAAAATLSLGYGSMGTGSLMDLLSGLINTGSIILSVELPNATGSYAPGSLGSYGPEASIGDVLTIPVASLGGAS